jgi:predicted dienelactone hydrolase
MIRFDYLGPFLYETGSYNTEASNRMNSGIRTLHIPDPAHQTSSPCVVQYPTLATAVQTAIGPYVFDAAPDAPLAPGRFPLCVVSHGGGGSHLLYRSIAGHLAAHGYIVVSPEHAGDNRNDRSLSNTDAAAIARPGQTSRAIDAVLADAFFRAAADADRIAMLGHSMGGYTALALVGGHPWSRSGATLPVVADARIRAAVLLAPATDWFMAPGALDDVHAPLLALAGEHDPITPADSIRRVLSHLPASTPLEFSVVPGAGHFSFLTPFPAALQRPNFPPSQDPPGFDRAQFHRALPETILDFLQRSLA